MRFGPAAAPLAPTGIEYLRLIDTGRTKELGQLINYEVVLPGQDHPTPAVDLMLGPLSLEAASAQHVGTQDRLRALVTPGRVSGRLGHVRGGPVDAVGAVSWGRLRVRTPADVPTGGWGRRPSR